MRQQQKQHHPTSQQQRHGSRAGSCAAGLARLWGFEQKQQPQVLDAPHKAVGHPQMLPGASTWHVLCAALHNRATPPGPSILALLLGRPASPCHSMVIHCRRSTPAAPPLASQAAWEPPGHQATRCTASCSCGRRAACGREKRKRGEGEHTQQWGDGWKVLGRLTIGRVQAGPWSPSGGPMCPRVYADQRGRRWCRCFRTAAPTSSCPRHHRTPDKYLEVGQPLPQLAII